MRQFECIRCGDEDGVSVLLSCKRCKTEILHESAEELNFCEHGHVVETVEDPQRRGYDRHIPVVCECGGVSFTWEQEHALCNYCEHVSR